MIKNFEEFNQYSAKCASCLDSKFTGMDEKRHIVLCGGTGCLSSSSNEITEEFKKLIKEKNLEDKVTVNQAGCFGFCSQGPFVKIYPEDTLYRLASANDTLPENTLRTPGTLRYEYAYDASTTPYVTVADTTSDFVAGFTGSFTANGGNIRFSDGVVSLTGCAGAEQQTGIIFAGTSRTTVAGEMRFGNADVLFADTAVVTTPKFSMADGQGYISTATMKDRAQLVVTGNGNDIVNGQTGGLSLVLAHWNATASLTIRDNAKLIAQDAVLNLSVDGTSTLTVEDDAEVRVKGLAYHNTNQNTSTVNLNGGSILIGEAGIRHLRGATPLLTLNFNGGTIGALNGSVTLGADAATAIASLTGMPVFESSANATLVLA